MIFYYLIQAFRKLTWFFRPPSLRDIARIDPNAPCPVCGERNGKIRCVWQAQPGPRPPKDLPPNLKVQCQHSCQQCGARWFEEPIVKVDPTRVLPSAARTDLEKAEDRNAMLQAMQEQSR